MTAKQYLKANPRQYVMVTREFGAPIYVAPLINLSITTTESKEEAQVWSALDNNENKLMFHRAITGYKGLQFEQI